MAFAHADPQPSPVADQKNPEKTLVHAEAEDAESNEDVQAKHASRKAGSVITILGSALANLSDGYQQNLASSTNVIFNHVLGKEVYTSSIQTRISNALLVGAVIGILIFGYTSDRFSRKGGMLVTSGLVAVGTLMATLAFQVDGAHHMLWFMTIARGAAGVGVGGSYDHVRANLGILSDELQASTRLLRLQRSKAPTSISTRNEGPFRF